MMYSALQRRTASAIGKWEAALNSYMKTVLCKLHSFSLMYLNTKNFGYTSIVCFFFPGGMLWSQDKFSLEPRYDIKKQVG